MTDGHVTHEHERRRANPAGVLRSAVAQPESEQSLLAHALADTAEIFAERNLSLVAKVAAESG